jgi:hypothetical protein
MSLELRYSDSDFFRRRCVHSVECVPRLLRRNHNVTTSGMLLHGQTGVLAFSHHFQSITSHESTSVEMPGAAPWTVLMRALTVEVMGAAIAIDMFAFKDCLISLQRLDGGVETNYCDDGE